MNIFKRMSRTLTEVGPTLRMSLFAVLLEIGQKVVTKLRAKRYDGSPLPTFPFAAQELQRLPFLARAPNRLFLPLIDCQESSPCKGFQRLIHDQVVKLYMYALKQDGKARLVGSREVR